MSDVQIPNLPAASTLSGQEQIEVVQFGVSVRASTSQILDLFTLPVASNALPTMNSTAVPGTSINYSRGDHIHPTDTSRYAASNPAGYQTAAQVTATLIPYALIDSQVFTGTPSLPTGTVGVTQTTADSSLKLATTAFVKAQGYAPTSSLGTMSTQNANSVAITGGAINGTTVGATTPSTGKFTTLAASGVVSGVGFTNLLAPYALVDSQAFTGTPSLPTGTTGVTQTALNNSTKLATTAYVDAASTALGLGTMATQNANAVAITGGSINNTAVGATTRSSGAFTTLAANGAATFTSSLTASPASANVVLSPTGTGVVTIAPATLGTINNMSVGATTPSTGAFTTLVATSINSTPIGATTPSTGAFTTLSATSTATFTGALTASPANASVTLSPTGTGTVTINPATLGHIDNTAVGATTASTGAFTTLSATTSANFTTSGTVTINPTTLGAMNNMTIGATTAAAGTFTNLTATGTVSGAGFTTLLTPYALVNSQVFTGTPSLPTGTIGVTQAAANNTTALATTAYVKSQNYLTANQTLTLSGDVTGSGTTAITATVVQLQGRPLAATAPSSGNLMGWNGATWLPVAAGAAAAGGSANQIQYNNGGVLGGIATTGTFAGSSVVMSIAPTFANSIAITSAAGGSSITMSKFTGAFNNMILGRTNALNRWALSVGNSTTETGSSNVGTDFTLDRYDDTGNFLDRPLSIYRTDGHAAFSVNAAFTAGLTAGSSTFTSACTVAPPGAASAILTLNKSSGSTGLLCAVEGQTVGSRRWLTILGNGTTEGGSNAGSDFLINRYSDTAVFIDTPFQIIRSTGQTTHLSPAKFPSNATNANTNPTGLDGVIIDGAAGNGLGITGSRAGSTRWRTSLGSNAAESGSNAGSDFAISNYSDAGALLGTPMTIGRASGYTYFNGNGATAVTSDTGPYGHGAVRVNKAGSGKTAQIAGFNNGLTRWVIDMGNAVAETGSNVGSDFAISRCADAGGGIDSPLSITRSSGQVLCPAGVFVGSTNIGPTFIELGTPGASTASYIDLHSGATNNDYDCRILSSGGTVAAGGGSLGITAASTAVSGNLTANGNLIGGTIYSSSGQLTLYQQSSAGFINLCDSAGNNGGSYSMAVRGLGSAFSAQVNLSGFAIYANSTSCNGTLTVLNSINTTAANARVDAIGGFSCRLGANGTPSGNVFSYYWNTDSHLYGSVDTTNLGWIAWSSDYRIKRDIAPLPSMWDRVKALKPISYFHKEWTPEWVQPKENGDAPDPLFRDDGVENWGFVAHELQETLTQSAATGVKDEAGLVQSPNPWVVIATLTKALQEAMARIEALEARA